MIKRWIYPLVASLAFGVAGSVASAAQPKGFPTDTVRIVVPFSAGGVADLLARTVADQLSKQWSQTVIVENKPGAGGNIAAAFVARSAGDGHTLLLAGTSIVINAVIDDAAPYTLKKDLLPVSQVANLPHIIVVNRSLPVNTLSELIEYANKHPGKLNFGSAGVGTSPHVAGELLKQTTGVDMIHVPFKGTTAAITELLAGRIHVMADAASPFMPHVTKGSLKVLATPSAERIPFLPDVPTVRESSPYDMQVSSWLSVWAPGGTPPETIREINRAIATVSQEESFRSMLEAQLVMPVASTAEEFSEFVDVESNKWRGVVEKAGVKRD